MRLKAGMEIKHVKNMSSDEHIHVIVFHPSGHGNVLGWPKNENSWI